MAIDFLGKESGNKIDKSSAEVKMHQPLKAKAQAKEILPPKAPASKPKPVAPSEELGDVNLMISFKAYLFKKRVVIFLISLIVIIIIGFAIFYLATRPPKIVVNTNINQVLNNNVNQLPPPAICGNNLIETGEQCDGIGCATDQTCMNCQCQTVVPPQPVCGNGTIEMGEQCDGTGCATDQTCVSCQCQAVTPPPPVCGNGKIETGEQCDAIGCPENLICGNSCQCEIPPNTELTPLRGALVKFNASADIFLIENNGELRLVDQVTVKFKAGQNVSQIKDRIYIINDKYQNIRRGEIVRGYIAWDPRVLTSGDLEPFK